MRPNSIIALLLVFGSAASIASASDGTDELRRYLTDPEATDLTRPDFDKLGLTVQQVQPMLDYILKDQKSQPNGPAVVTTIRRFGLWMEASELKGVYARSKTGSKLSSTTGSPAWWLRSLALLSPDQRGFSAIEAQALLEEFDKATLQGTAVDNAFIEEVIDTLTVAGDRSAIDKAAERARAREQDLAKQFPVLAQKTTGTAAGPVPGPQQWAESQNDHTLLQYSEDATQIRSRFDELTAIADDSKRHQALATIGLTRPEDSLLYQYALYELERQTEPATRTEVIRKALSAYLGEDTVSDEHKAHAVRAEVDLLKFYGATLTPEEQTTYQNAIR